MHSKPEPADGVCQKVDADRWGDRTQIGGCRAKLMLHELRV
jgi:hypothetical protein